jgi:CDP-4-dehydro-6-deoxyglucose reductase
MNSPHELNIFHLTSSQNKIKHQRKINHQWEMVDEKLVLEGVYQAREKTIHLLEEIKHHLRESMNEVEARKMSLGISQDFGVSKHWHPPYIRFGSGTALSFHEPLQRDNIFQLNQPYYIDLGPVWSDYDNLLEYEGDYGDTFIFGENKEAQQCILQARRIFNEAKIRWSSEKLTGKDIYHYMRQRCHEAGYLLMEDFDGHRISDFPHHKYTSERLANIPFIPSKSLWILELQMKDPNNQFGAFMEDLL